MNRLVILNANNQSMEVSVVRYFGDGSNNYFIFSLNEIDIQGRMNIYVTKVINQGGTIVGTNIIDDVEWSNVKLTLQKIIKENKTTGSAAVPDLSIDGLNNIKVLDRRALKLLANSVDMLNKGYKFNVTSTSESSNDPVQLNPIINDQPVKYEQPVQVTPSQYEQPAQVAPAQYEQPVPVVPVQYEQPVQVEPAQYEQPVPVAPVQYEQPVQVEPAQYEQPVPVAPVQYDQPVQVEPVQYEQPVSEEMVQYEQPVQVESVYDQPAQVNQVQYENDDFEQLYLAEREKNSKLIEENNLLLEELNNYKLMVSDIKDILSR